MPTQALELILANRGILFRLSHVPYQCSESPVWVKRKGVLAQDFKTDWRTRGEAHVKSVVLGPHSLSRAFALSAQGHRLKDYL